MTRALRRLHQLIEDQIAARAFPSAVLLAALDGEPLIHQAYGKARLDSAFDLASLTKPLATTAAMMLLDAEGLLSPQTRLRELLPSLRTKEVGETPLSALLSHSSGLPAWQPYYERAATLGFKAAKQAVRRWAASESLVYEPGSRSLYSDLGFILLDWALERAVGKRLDRLLAQRLTKPLGLERMTFVDLESSQDARPRQPFVPTERCPRRGRLLGEVHDDNTHAMGGISGHAGLFGSAFDVHLLTRELVAAYEGRRSIFSREVVRRYWRARPVRGGSWALGWDRPSGARPSGGGAFGPASVGHLGFTGTSLWIDPAARYWVIFLTNRVYGGREPNPMKVLRPRLHDTVARAVASLAVG
ncbi:MAG: serine hydrolase [Deltaproteobacteria bacterium]|nr:serine hydrolase [Deltaproteobacteria bacterium]